MKSLFKNCSVALTTGATALSPVSVQAQDMEVELVSNGGGNSYRLPDNVSQVDLVQQLRGNGRFGRSWGYALPAKDLWVDAGCGGRIKVTRTAPASQSGVSNAGLALLANHNSQKSEQDGGHNNANQGQGGQPGWQPGGPNGRVFRSVGGLCLNVDKSGGSIRPGSPVQIWNCHGQWNQQFNWGRNGEITVGKLCLDIANANPNDGAQLIVWQCSGAANRRWRARGRDIVSDLNGKCMAVSEGVGRNGQRVVTWGCNGSTNQNWWW